VFDKEAAASKQLAACPSYPLSWQRFNKLATASNNLPILLLFGVFSLGAEIFF
jgi:hypothetical protein